MKTQVRVLTSKASTLIRTTALSSHTSPVGSSRARQPEPRHSHKCVPATKLRNYRAATGRFTTVKAITTTPAALGIDRKALDSLSLCHP